MNNVQSIIEVVIPKKNRISINFIRLLTYIILTNIINSFSKSHIIRIRISEFEVVSNAKPN